MSDANLQVGIDAGGAVAGSRTVVRSLDDIYSSANALDTKLRGLESTLGRVGANPGLTQAKAAMQQMQSPLQSIKLELEKIESRIVRIGATALALGAVHVVFGKIREAILGAVKAVDDFQIAVISIAASLTQIRIQNGETDIAGAYEKSSRYAGVLALKLQEIDKNSFANYKGLMAMLQVMTAQGQVLDVNNKKQVEAFTNLSNAIAIMTPGQDQQMQMYQETRALMSGVADRHSQVARMIDQQIKAQGIYKGGLKEVAALGRQHGDTMERLALYLQGVGAASKDISKTWSTVVATFETALNFIQRAAFGPIVADLTTIVSLFSKLMTANTGTISDTMQRSWGFIKDAIFDIDEKTKELKFSPEFLNTLKTASQLAVTIIDSFAILIKWTIKYSAEIKGLIEVYVAYKVVSLAAAMADRALAASNDTVTAAIINREIALARLGITESSALTIQQQSLVAARETLLVSAQEATANATKQASREAEVASINAAAQAKIKETAQTIENIQVRRWEIGLEQDAQATKISGLRLNAELLVQERLLAESRVASASAYAKASIAENGRAWSTEAIAIEKTERDLLSAAIARETAARTALESTMIRLLGLEAEEISLQSGQIATEQALVNAKVRAIEVDAAATTAATRHNAALLALGETTGFVTAANLTKIQTDYVRLVEQDRLTGSTLAATAVENAHTEALAMNTAAKNANSIANQVLTASTNLLQGALALVGGPIGALIIAIGALTYAWVKLSEAEEENRSKKIKAIFESDLSVAQRELDDVNKKLAEAEKARAKKTDPVKASADEEQDRLNKMMITETKLRKELADAEQNLRTIRLGGASVARDEAEERVRSAKIQVDYFRKVSDETAKAKAKLEEYHKEDMKGYKGSGKHEDDKEAAKALKLAEQYEKDYLADMEKWRKAQEQLADTYDKAAIAAVEQRRDRELAILKNQYDQGLLSQADYLDKQYQQQAAASDKALEQLESAALRNDQAYYAALEAEPSKPTDGNPVAVEAYNKAILLTVKLLQESEAAWAKVDAAAAKAAVDATVNEGAKAATRRENAKAALEYESQILSMAGGQTYAATLKQIEADKLGRKQIDAKTDALRDQLGAVKALKAAQDEANRINAIKDQTTDINISMMNDPYAEQRAALEEHYRREAELIQQNIDLKIAAGTLEMGEYEALSAKLIAMAQERDKKIADSQKNQSMDGWEAVVKQASKAFPQLAGFEKAIYALRKDYTIKNEKGVKDETRSNLSMYGAYAGAAGAVFEGLAATQDQTSKEGFETAKSYNIAAAVMSTASGMMAQLAGPDGWSPLAWARAALVGITGAIQVAQIASTSFGGGGSVSAPPSGSFASSGSASGTGLQNIKTPLTSLQDTRSEETYNRMIASTDNVAVAIGRLSKSMDDLTALFKEGGAGMGLVTNAPGLDVSLSKNQSTLGKIVSDAKTIFTDFLGAINPANFVSSTMNFLFGGGTATTGAGIALAVNKGTIAAFDYIQKTYDGGLFGDDSTWRTYNQNNDVEKYMGALMQPFIADIENMAKTLGTTFDATAYSGTKVDIAIAGKTPDEISAELEKWMTDTLQGMSMLVGGLQENVGAYDDAYAMLKKYNNALVTTNQSLELIGATTLQGSFANAKMADALQTLMGGADKFTESVDTYFTTMFTDAEQEAAKTAQAKRTVNMAMIEIEDNYNNQRLEEAKTSLDSMRGVWAVQYNSLSESIRNIYSPDYLSAVDFMAQKTDEYFTSIKLQVPQTRDEFKALVNSLDLTTDSGASTFAALMNIADSFGTVMDAADAAAEHLKTVNSAMQDLDVRYYYAIGDSDTADALERQLSAQREIEDAIANEMGDAYIERLREVLALEESLVNSDSILSTATDSYNEALSALQNAYTAEKDALTDIYNTQLDTYNTQLKTLNTTVSDLTNYVKSLRSAADSMQLESVEYATEQYNEARAVLAATLAQSQAGDFSGLDTLSTYMDTLTGISAESYSNSTDYQRDFWSTKNSLTSLADLADVQLTADEQQVDLLQSQIDLLKSNHDAQLEALDNQLSILSGTYEATLSISDALAAYLPALTAYQTASGTTTDINTLTIDEIVTNAYNAIGRIGFGDSTSQIDAAGFDYWSNALESGAIAIADFQNSFLSAVTTYTGDNSDGYASSKSIAGILLNSGYKLPGFDVGSSYIPYDMTANIHEGEMIIDRTSADIMRRYGIRANGSADNALVAELVREIKGLRQDMRSADVEMVKETKRTNKILDRVMPDGDALQVRVAA